MCSIQDMIYAITRAHEAEVLGSDPKSFITLLADPETTGGLLTSNRSLLKEGSAGAPPHFHAHSAELFFVLSGSLLVHVGEDVVTLNEGDFLVVPPKVPHSFAPAPGSDADVLFVFTPGTARFDYYRLLDRFYAGEATAQDLMESQELYDNHYVERN